MAMGGAEVARGSADYVMLSLDAQKNLSGRRAEEVIAFYNYAVARLR